MGDPNGNWNDTAWTAEFLWDKGVSLIPLDGAGKPLVDWRAVMQSDVSRLPLGTLMDWVNGEAEGLAIAFASSFNGDLWCRTFDRHAGYMESVTLMGQNARPLACTLKEEKKHHVLFMMDDLSKLESLEEIGSGRYQIDHPPGTIRGGCNLLRIPPGEGLKWVQEPVVDMAHPNQANLFYYDPVEIGLLPPF